MKDYAKQEWLREPRKHKVRDAAVSTLIYAATGLIGYWFLVELSA